MNDPFHFLAEDRQILAQVDVVPKLTNGRLPQQDFRTGCRRGKPFRQFCFARAGSGIGKQFEERAISQRRQDTARKTMAAVRRRCATRRSSLRQRSTASFLVLSRAWYSSVGLGSISLQNNLQPKWCK